MNGFTSRGVNGDGDSPTKTKIADDDAVKSNANRGIFDKFQHSDCYKTPIAKPRPVNESDKDKVKCLARCGSPEARAALYRNGHDPYVATADVCLAKTNAPNKATPSTIGRVADVFGSDGASGTFSPSSSSSSSFDLRPAITEVEAAPDLRSLTVDPTYPFARAPMQTNLTTPPSKKKHTTRTPASSLSKKKKRKNGLSHGGVMSPAMQKREVLDPLHRSYDKLQHYSWSMLSRLTDMAEDVIEDIK